MKKLSGFGRMFLLVYVPVILVIALTGGWLGRVVFLYNFFSGFVNAGISSIIGICISYIMPNNMREKIHTFMWKCVGRNLEKLILPQEKVVVKVIRNPGYDIMIVFREQWEAIRDWYRADEIKDYVIDAEVADGEPTRIIRLNKDNIIELEMLEITPIRTLLHNIRKVAAMPTVSAKKTVCLLVVMWILELWYIASKMGLSALSELNKSVAFEAIINVSVGILYLVLFCCGVNATMAMRKACKSENKYLVYGQKIAFSPVSLLPNVLTLIVLIGTMDKISVAIQFVAKKIVT